MASSPPPPPPHRPSSPDALTNLNLPKYPSRGPPTPPPAYFPRQPLSVPVIAPVMNATRTSFANNAHLAARFAGIHAPLPPPPRPVNAADLAGWQDIMDDYSDGDGGDGAGSTRSGITVHISTAVKIHGDKNVVCLSTTPAENARVVAEAVTRAIARQDADMEGGGGGGAIPMIDEEGRPRPLRIEIEAGLEVHGQGNVLGGDHVVLKALQCGKRRREEDEGDDVDEHAPRRRSRARSAGV